jgi:hypothetical protein
MAKCGKLPADQIFQWKHDPNIRGQYMRKHLIQKTILMKLEWMPPKNYFYNYIQKINNLGNNS